MAPLMEEYAQTEDGVDAIRYPFWALVSDDLWTADTNSLSPVGGAVPPWSP